MTETDLKTAMRTSGRLTCMVAYDSLGWDVTDRWVKRMSRILTSAELDVFREEFIEAAVARFIQQPGWQTTARTYVDLYPSEFPFEATDTPES